MRRYPTIFVRATIGLALLTFVSSARAETIQLRTEPGLHCIAAPGNCNSYFSAPFTHDDFAAADVERTAAKFLLAVQEAGKVYRHIAAVKGTGRFVPEISMDETDSPQTPPELLVILAAIADEGVPIQTIAPKFTGRRVLKNLDLAELAAWTLVASLVLNLDETLNRN